MRDLSWRGSTRTVAITAVNSTAAGSPSRKGETQAHSYVKCECRLLGCHGKRGHDHVHRERWVNLQRPSGAAFFVLMAKGGKGSGWQLPRSQDRSGRAADYLLWKGTARGPADRGVSEVRGLPPDPRASRRQLASTEDEHYGRCWRLSRGSRRGVGRSAGDMPGAEVMAGMCRTFRSRRCRPLRRSRLPSRP